MCVQSKKMKLYNSILFLYFFIIVNIVENFDLFRKKVLKLDKIVNCPRYSNLTIRFTEIRLQKIKRVYVLSSKIIIKYPVSGDLMIELTLTRCYNKDSPDTCEKYQKLNVRKMCELLLARNKPWSPFIDNVKPKMGCPIVKGIYYVQNTTFDGDAFSGLPIEGFYWKVEANLREITHKNTILCLNLEGQIVPV